MIAAFGSLDWLICSIFDALSTGIGVFISADFEIGFFRNFQRILDALNLSDQTPIGVVVVTKSHRFQNLLPMIGDALLENPGVLALDRGHDFPAFSSRP